MFFMSSTVLQYSAIILHHIKSLQRLAQPDFLPRCKNVLSADLPCEFLPDLACRYTVIAQKKYSGAIERMQNHGELPTHPSVLCLVLKSIKDFSTSKRPLHNFTSERLNFISSFKSYILLLPQSWLKIH